MKVEDKGYFLWDFHYSLLDDFAIKLFLTHASGSLPMVEL